MAVILYIASALLLHAGYSSYEFHHFVKTTANQINSLPFPQDITFEVILSLILFLIQLLVLNTNSSKLSLVDFGRVIKSDEKLKNISMNKAVVEDEIRGGGGFRAVETRINFFDLNAKRVEFMKWKTELESELKEKEGTSSPDSSVKDVSED